MPTSRAQFPQPRFSTARLVLRPLVPADASTIAATAGDRALSDTMISIPHPYPAEAAEHYVRQRTVDFATGQGAAFAITLPEHSNAVPLPDLPLPDLPLPDLPLPDLPLPDLIGIVEIRDLERQHDQAELSFWLAPAVWGKGYMSEAIAPILTFAFETLALNRIQAYHMKRNPASGQVLQKNGFVPEGVLRQRVCKWGVYEDVVLLALLRQDWKNGSGRDEG